MIEPYELEVVGIPRHHCLLPEAAHFPRGTRVTCRHVTEVHGSKFPCNRTWYTDWVGWRKPKLAWKEETYAW